MPNRRVFSKKALKMLKEAQSRAHVAWDSHVTWAISSGVLVT
jgi:hypothetical protein